MKTALHEVLVEFFPEIKSPVPKIGSKIGSEAYSAVFDFTPLPLNCLPGTERPFSEGQRDQVSAAVRDYTKIISGLYAEGNYRETDYVQPHSRALLAKIMKIYFPGEDVYFSTEREYDTRNLLQSRYTGKTDAAIVANEYNIGLLTWEDKNMNVDLNETKSAPCKSAINQAGSEMAGEIYRLLKLKLQHGRVSGILTNGRVWIFLTCLIEKNDELNWFHFTPVCTFDTVSLVIDESGIDVVVAGLEFSLNAGDVILRKLVKLVACKFDDRVRASGEDDEDDDDDDEGSDDKKSELPSNFSSLHISTPSQGGPTAGAGCDKENPTKGSAFSGKGRSIKNVMKSSSFGTELTENALYLHRRMNT
jgi:hypothetical protein